MKIDIIKKLCSERKIKWSTHAATRIQERGIMRTDIVNCLMGGEIIEDYPLDYPYPSCLVFGYTLNKKVLHVVVGCDEEYLYIITAYFPNSDKFEPDMKTRKEQ